MHINSGSGIPARDWHILYTVSSLYCLLVVLDKTYENIKTLSLFPRYNMLWVFLSNKLWIKLWSDQIRSDLIWSESDHSILTTTDTSACIFILVLESQPLSYISCTSAFFYSHRSESRLYCLLVVFDKTFENIKQLSLIPRCNMLWVFCPISFE